MRVCGRPSKNNVFTIHHHSYDSVSLIATQSTSTCWSTHWNSSKYIIQCCGFPTVDGTSGRQPPIPPAETDPCNTLSWTQHPSGSPPVTPSCCPQDACQLIIWRHSFHEEWHTLTSTFTHTYLQHILVHTNIRTHTHPSTHKVLLPAVEAAVIVVCERWDLWQSRKAGSTRWPSEDQNIEFRRSEYNELEIKN